MFILVRSRKEFYLSYWKDAKDLSYWPILKIGDEDDMVSEDKLGFEEVDFQYW